MVGPNGSLLTESKSGCLPCLRLGYEKPVASILVSFLTLLFANTNGSQTQCCLFPYKDAYMARN